MKVWVVAIGEPVPIEEGASDRLHRAGYLAHFLAEHGHQVTWWTSTFDHFRKKHLFDNDHSLSINERLEIRLLHGCGYRSNVSLARFRDHRQVARRFANLARQETHPPDIIVAALPTIELCRESTKYGMKHKIPVVLDMRDMWPDIFLELLPGPLRLLGRPFLIPLYIQARKACRNATAITGITEAFVDWGIRRGGRVRSPLDRRFAMGYVEMKILPEKLQAADVKWKSRGIGVDENEFNVAFFGTIGRQFVFEPIIDAARIIKRQGRNIRFIMCGDGDRLDHYKNLSKGLGNVVWPGWVGAADIRSLMRLSAIGIAPYRESLNFTMNISNKPPEYLSAGLPIALGLRHGILRDLLQAENCGFCYDEDAEKLVLGINDLFDHPEKLQNMSSNASRVYKQQFVADKVYSNMMAYLEGLTEK